MIGPYILIVIMVLVFSSVVRDHREEIRVLKEETSIQRRTLRRLKEKVRLDAVSKPPQPPPWRNA